MSHNQSRAEKSDSHYKKPGGRPGFSGHQRTSSGGGGKSGGGTGLPPASSNSQPSSSYSTHRSFKKSNGHGAQSRVTAQTGNTQFRATQNGARAQPSVLSGGFSTPTPHEPVKSTESHAETSNQTISTAPSSQPVSAPFNSTSPRTPVKGDTKGEVSLQFGSFSPGFVNGMQIPARTSSAPPNLDEQKRDQARQDSTRAVAGLPTSSINRQQPSKDVEQSKIRVTHPPPQTKRGVHAQVPAAPVASSSQNTSTFPVSGVQLTVPIQPPQVPMQFGIPNPHMAAQGMTATSLQMPISLPVGGSSQMLQQVFIPSLQAHPLQTQAVMHQGHGMSFPPQISHQIGSQLGNLHLGSPQYAQQQAGNFGTSRRSVKITHPDTHEELRLVKRSDLNVDTGSSGPGSHTNAPLHPQPVSFGPSHQMNYFSHVQPNPIFFQTPSSLHLASSQMPPSSQASGFNHATGEGSQFNHATEVRLAHRADGVNSVASPASELVKSNPRVGYDRERILSSSVSVSSTVDSMSNVTKVPSEISTKQLKSVPNPAPSSVPLPLTTENSSTPSPDASVVRVLPGDTAQMAIKTDDQKRETVRGLHSAKDESKKTNKKVQQQSQIHRQEETCNPADSQTMSTSRELAEVPDKIRTPPKEGISTAVLTDSSLGFGNVTLEKTTVPSSETHEDFPAFAEKFLPDVHANFPVATAEKRDSVRVEECPVSERINESYDKINFDNLSGVNNVKQADITLLDAQLKEVDRRKLELYEKTQLDYNCNNDVNIPADSLSLESSKCNDQCANPNTEQSTLCHELVRKGSEHIVAEALPGNGGQLNDKMGIISESSCAPFLNVSVSDVTFCNSVSSEVCSEKTMVLDSEESTDGQNVMVKDSDSGKPNDDFVVVVAPGLKDGANSELKKIKNIPAKGKKKRKELLQKADAAGLTSDLYMAYKGPEEKQQTSVSSESVHSCPDMSLRPVSSSSNEEVVGSKEDGKSKAEPDDWEDAADISNQTLESLDDKKDIYGGLRLNEEDENGVAGTKKYSRDFLLTLSGHCTDLPAGFEIANDLMEAVMGTKVSTSKVSDHNRIPNSGRTTDRVSGVSRTDYRGNGIIDDDRWIKSPGPYAYGQDLRVEMGQGGSDFGFRQGQGVSQGGLRNLRGQTPAQFVGGYLSGPLPAMAFPGGVHRGGPDADRWQRATGFQKGLIPSPQSPLQVMHKASMKYEVRQVRDIEEAKQRQLKAILNKLTPQNFDRLFEQVKEVNIDNTVTLTGVISQIFDKALTEPTFCEMYANFCQHLAGELPDFVEDNEKITFKRLLLNKCQEEFERGEREQAEAVRVDGDGEVNQSKEEREQKRIFARRRMLGNIRLIGELYKKKMLTERIMHACIKKLLGQYQNPDEEDIEALCKLMSTIGEMIDHPKAKEHMDAYFEIMRNMSNNMTLSSRVRFMLKDAIDLRLNKWQQRRKVEGPKKIDEVHRDAAQERQTQASRLARGPSIGNSARRGQPLDLGPRASYMFPSPNTQMSAFRNMPPQARGFGTPDIRFDDRHPYDKRTIAAPLPQRPNDDNSITLGPQGGLARGMSIRGQPMLSGAFNYDTYSDHGESRRMPAGPNGYSSLSEWTSHQTRQEPSSRYVPERSTRPLAYDQSYSQERMVPQGNRDPTYVDHSFDRSRPISPATQMQRTSLVSPSASSGKVWPEERLRDMSMAAIREFYSAMDEKEVSLCIGDMNTPSFHSSMICIWVIDSFERKDRDRDLLTGLLVNLSKTKNAILSPVQLINGFASVLATLEDTITDAPKAAEFLGRMFAKIILENIVPLGEIGQLIRQGGEEPGRLVEIGLGYEVLKCVFETIRLETGEPKLDEMCKSSNVRLEDFRYGQR